MGHHTSRTHLLTGLTLLLLSGTLLAQGLQLGPSRRLLPGEEKPTPVVRETPAPALQPLPGRVTPPVQRHIRPLLPQVPRPRREATPPPRRAVLPQLGRLLHALRPTPPRRGYQQAQLPGGLLAAPSGAVARVNPTKLEVRLHGGDFEQWVTSRTVSSPQNLTFRWRTSLPEAVSGFWVVSKTPFGPDPSSPFWTAGFLGPAPDPLKTAWITINFASLLPETPPEQPVIYYVRLYLCGPGFTYLEPPSNTVQIIHVPPAPPTQFEDLDD